jgi:hypothetical protein
MTVVTYVDDRYHVRDWTIEPPIAVFHNITDFLKIEVSGDVLIIHGGHRDASVGPPLRKPLLTDALLRVCGRSGRAIVFSGGQPAIPADILSAELTRNGYEDGLHYLVLTTVERLNEEIDLQALSAAQISGEWRIDGVKRPNAKPTLLTLSYLSQAALLAADPSEVDAETMTLLGGYQVVTEFRQQRTGPSNLLTPLPWRASLGELSVDDVQAKLDREWPSRAGAATAVRQLVKAIYEQPADLTPQIMARAYRDVQRALGMTREAQR